MKPFFPLAIVIGFCVAIMAWPNPKQAPQQKPRPKAQLDQSGNCWRFAAGDPAKNGEDALINPPGWNENDEAGSDPTGCISCNAMHDALIAAGAMDSAGEPPIGWHRVRMFYADNIPPGKRSILQPLPEGGFVRVFNEKPMRELHFSRETPSGKWYQKFGVGFPEPTTRESIPLYYKLCAEFFLPDHFDVDAL